MTIEKELKWLTTLLKVFLGENAAELATGSGKVVLERLRQVFFLSRAETGAIFGPFLPGTFLHFFLAETGGFVKVWFLSWKIRNVFMHIT